MILRNFNKTSILTRFLPKNICRSNMKLTSASFLLFCRVLRKIARKKADSETTGTATKTQKNPINTDSEIQFDWLVCVMHDQNTAF